METITFRYCFRLADGSREIFDLQLDADHLNLLTKPPEILPYWTDLEFHQCPNCPLTHSTHPHCPIAANIVNIVRSFEGLVSYEQIHVEVITKERLTSQDTTAQRGISSLMGLVIAASGCPHAAFFKPMARFHLPLASKEETIYRAVSTYLLAQYFLRKEGKSVDFDLKGLEKIYQNMQVINTFLAKRLRDATATDSSVNAIILLDIYAKSLPFVIGESLEDIRHLFEPFFSSFSSS